MFLSTLALRWVLIEGEAMLLSFELKVCFFLIDLITTVALAMAFLAIALEKVV